MIYLVIFEYDYEGASFVKNPRAFDDKDEAQKYCDVLNREHSKEEPYSFDKWVVKEIKKG